MVGVKLADSATPRAKKSQQKCPVCQISAEERAKKFKEDIFFLTVGCCTADVSRSQIFQELKWKIIQRLMMKRNQVNPGKLSPQSMAWLSVLMGSDKLRIF